MIINFVRITALLFLLGMSSYGEVITNRANVASKIYGARAVVMQKDGVESDAAKVIDGSYKDNSSVEMKGVPASVIIYFPAPVQIKIIRIYPGMLIYAPNPSGDCGIKDYIIEGRNNGAWLTLAKAENQPDFMHSEAKGNADYYYEHKFKPTTVNAIRVTVKRSGFTGRTLSSDAIVPESERASYIREIEVYEARKSSRNDSFLGTILKGDFRLPVYRNQKKAVLMLEGEPYLKCAGIIEVRDERSGKLMEPPRKIELRRGRWSECFDISNWDSGRYLVKIMTNDKDSPVKGSITRLIHIDKQIAVKPPMEPINVKNRKIFPIDDFEFEIRKNVTTTVNPLDEIIEATHPLAPNRGRQMARHGMWFDMDGNAVIPFWDDLTKGSDRKNHFVWSKDLKKWHIVDVLPERMKLKSKSPQIFERYPDAMVPHWSPKTPLSKAKVRFYDPATDKKPPLNQVYIEMFTKSKLPNLEEIGLINWSSYPVWVKDGEWIILTRKPINMLKFQYDLDELDKDIDANDNFGGQYLSDDGKTLYFLQAGRIRRFKPFTVEYDNIPDASRIMKIHYTQDGFKWKSKYFTLPDENDNFSYQHYGAFIFRVQKNFYLTYTFVYNSLKQQIYCELNYSRDGFNYYRFNGQPPFASNGALKTWTSGLFFIESSPVERDGKYYLPLGSARRGMHFYIRGENVTSGFLERSFGGRELAEKWPYFKAIGGWKGLADDMNNANSTVGLGVFRKDGWLSADAKDGMMVSRKFLSKGSRLFLNAKGNIKIEVLDESGKEISEYCGVNAGEFSGDSVKVPITWSKGTIETLPETIYKLRLKLSGAKLYTIEFCAK